MKPMVNVQDGATERTDVADLGRFAAALVICAWQPPAGTLAVLDQAGVAVGVWRVTENPTGWPNWPRAYLQRCKLLLVDNEPDVQGWTTWGSAVAAAWAAAGGVVCDPAWSDETKYQPSPYATGVVTAHVYPRGLGAANIADCRKRANGRPVVVTEAGDATAPGQILVELQVMGVTEPMYLYTFRALNAAAQPAYNLAGVALAQPKGPTMLYGLDTSDNNNPADVAALVPLRDFWIIKATQGNYDQDADFPANWAAAKASGKPRIAYHFHDPRSDALTQAQYFLDYIRQSGGWGAGDNFAFDQETPSGDPSFDYAGAAHTFLSYVRQQTGAVAPMYYSYLSFILQYLSMAYPDLWSCALWVSALQPNAPATPIKGWQTFALWQDTWTEVLNGATVSVDGDVTDLTVPQLEALGVPPVATSIPAAAAQRWSALGQPVPTGPNAIYAAWCAEYAATVGLGSTTPSAVPAPPITPEVVPDPTTPDAYRLCDDGSIYVWRTATGLVYKVEDAQRAATMQRCGWANKAA